jgi:DNA-binding NtrC family response regulator
MRVTIIGDLDGYFGKASMIATTKGARVRQVLTIDQALDSLRKGLGADLLIVDVKQDISYLVNSLLREHISVPIVACGIENNKDLAVKAIQSGAKEYIPLPPDEDFIAAILETISVQDEKIVIQSPAIQEVMKIADQIAATNATVLITGKSGCGKEVMSRYIHQHSNRHDKPFISINCAAIPENLLESELFGHEKGAFTGAISKRIGKFEESNNGTLLLDEISEIDLRLQAKLLRAIQEQEIDRVGGTQPIKLNLRIIATSNRDLLKEVKAGNFREDLYFRLNIINLKLPTLAERKDDIEHLAKHFVDKYCKANNIPQKILPDNVIEYLKKYTWPGNVRELENAIYRAILLSSGDYITIESLNLTPDKDETLSTNTNLVAGLVGRTIESVEKEFIVSTIHHCLGNHQQAANILGISLQKLKNKIKSYENDMQLID